MEKKKSKRLREAIVIAVIWVCLGLIILELQSNIHNIL